MNLVEAMQAFGMCYFNLSENQFIDLSQGFYTFDQNSMILDPNFSFYYNRRYFFQLYSVRNNVYTILSICSTLKKHDFRRASIFHVTSLYPISHRSPFTSVIRSCQQRALFHLSHYGVCFG